MLKRLIRNPRLFLSAVRRKAREALPVDAWLGNGRAWLPSRISVDVTYACNAKCTTCCQWGIDTQFEPRPLDRNYMLKPGLLAKVISEAQAWRPTVYLTGGEPLLHPKLGQMIAGIKNAGLYCSLNTNGILLVERSVELCDAGLDKVIISIEPTPETQVANRGIHLDIIRAGITALRKRGAGPEIALNCVITPINWRDLKGLTDMSTSLGISNMSLQHFMFSDRKLIIAHRTILAGFGEQEACYGNSVMDTTEMDAAAICQGLKRLRCSGLKPRIDPPVPEKRLQSYYASAQTDIPGQCLAPWTTVAILPDGSISICRPMRLGTAGQDAIRDVWNGAKAQQFRRTLLKQGLLPGCTRCCARQYK